MPTDPTRVKAIFLEATELPDGAARAAYLDRACGADAGLRERVEALFRSHDPDCSFLGIPAAVIPDHAATRAFSSESDHAATRTGGGSSSDDEIPLTFLKPATRPDSLGRIGHYEVLQTLGQGGFGIVFRAFDDVLHRVVAVKVLSPQMAATSAARKRFLREARSSAQVRHENVVQVYEVGEQPLPHIVMEFIPGETLQQRLDRTGPVEPAEVVRVGHQIAEGLAAAHATDLIHRDIKPGNVLLEGGMQRVKITDFGLARAADDASISQSGIIAGTPMYMAPEQAKGETLDQRADLFSLGSVLYQMTAGRPPFRANGTLAVLKRVAEDTPRPIREIIPETPQWLCHIISKLHAKNPDDRYQSAREVADVLADCEGQLKANAKLKDLSRIPRSKPPATEKSVRRKWVAAVAVLLLPVIALAVTEFTGVTHLLRQQATTSPVPPVSGPAQIQTVTDPNQQLLTDAVLVLNFEKDTFYEKDGKTYVRDLSGKGNDGLCEKVAFTPDGKADGGLQCNGGQVQLAKSLINQQPNYTITAWCRMDDLSTLKPREGRSLYLTAPPNDPKVPCFGLVCTPEMGCNVAAWNHGHIDHWKGVETAPGAIPVEWAFLAVSLADGGTDSGKLRIVINDKMMVKPSQTVASNDQHVDWIGYDMEGAVLDELTVYQRALSDEEIAAIRTRGLKGIPLGSEKPSPPTAEDSLLNDALLVMNFEKDTFYEKDGKKYVRDLSGRGNDGQCENVAFTPDGQAGGALQCNGGFLRLPVDMLNQVPDYTIAAWVNSDQEGEQEFRLLSDVVFDETKGEGLWHISLCPNHIFLSSWNRNFQPDLWKGFNAPLTVKGKGWQFVAVRLRNGGVGMGKLEVTLNEQTVKGTLQMLDGDGDAGKLLLAFKSKGKVDELVILKRAVSDSELQQIYQQGRNKKPLAAGLKLTPRGPINVDDVWVKRVAAVPAEQQVDAVKAKLKDLNPGFEGDVEHKIEDGVVTELRIVTDKVTNISPIQVFSGLRVLDFSGTGVFDGRRNGRLADLSTLKGMNLAGLRELRLSGTKVRDEGLAYFQECKSLTRLHLRGTRVGDKGLAYLKSCTQLIGLDLVGTAVTDEGLIHLKEFKNLTFLDLSYTKISNVGLAYFKDCNFKNLILNGTPITNAGLAHLEGLKSLTELGLDDTQVNDEGLAHFKDCKNLTFLHLGGTRVSDVGLAHFKECKNLTLLALWRTQVTDEGLAHLKNCRNLTELYLNDTQVSDNGLAHLKDCKNLIGLGLAGTQVSDDGLVHFKDCLNLSRLWLYNTKVSDVGLAHFKDCKNLTELRLQKTKVTAAKIEELKKVLPNCKIEWDDGPIKPK